MQKDLGLVEDVVLARRCALVNDCRVENFKMHDGLDVWLGVECSMSVYLSRRGCCWCGLERLRLE